LTLKTNARDDGRSGDWSVEEVAKINELIPQAITLKPIVYLVNLDAASFKRKGNRWLVPIGNWVNTHGGGEFNRSNVLKQSLKVH
jgi:hypothetical protein